MEKCRLEVDALPEIAQQIGDREAAGLLEQPPHGERTCRVCDLRLIAGQPPEARLQRAEGHAPGREPHALLGPRQIARFERGRQPFVQPRRHAARGEASDEGMCELV